MGIVLWPLAVLETLGLIQHSAKIDPATGKPGGIRPTPLGWIALTGAAVGLIYLLRRRT